MMMLPVSKSNLSVRETYTFPFFTSTLRPLSRNPRRALASLSFKALLASSRFFKIASTSFNLFSRAARSAASFLISPVLFLLSLLFA